MEKKLALEIAQGLNTQTDHTLSREQQRVLLHKHASGDFPGQKWSTVDWLLRNGYLADQQGRVIVTSKGREYCDRHHMEMA